MMSFALNFNRYHGAILILGFASLVTWLLIPADKLFQVSEVLGRLRGDPGVLCMDYERLSLNDPDSAKLRIVSQLEDGGTTIEYSAKNSYGGYVSARAICSIRNGKVDALSTSMARTTANLRGHAECLAAKKEDRDAGNANGVLRYEECLRNLAPLK